jgi:hypothetical protein
VLLCCLCIMKWYVLGLIYRLLLTVSQLVQQGSSNIVSGHLKGAMTIMKTWPEEEFTPAGMFLERVIISPSPDHEKHLSK